MKLGESLQASFKNSAARLRFFVLLGLTCPCHESALGFLARSSHGLCLGLDGLGPVMTFLLGLEFAQS